MTNHPLTDEMCKKIQLHDIFRSDADCMRVAADWQLEQVIEWIRENLPDGYYGLVNDDEVITDLQEAMRPLHPVLHPERGEEES